MKMRRDWLICLLLAAVTILVYWPVTTHEFTNYDDPLYVTENPHVQEGLTRAGAAWAFGRIAGEGTYWHPLTWLSHMLDCQLFGLKAGWHHLTNLLFHVANVLLLFLLLKRMTGAIWQSAMVAALFALHPLQVDTVAWVAERKNVLSTLFWLLTLLAYVRYAERPGVIRYLLVVAAFALGLMSKPMLVTVPCVLLLLDYWPLERLSNAGLNLPGSQEPGFQRRRLPVLLVEKIPLFGLAAVSCAITVMAHQRLGLLAREEQLAYSSRVANAVVAYISYLRKIVWPTDLAVLYPHPGRWPEDIVFFSVVILAGISVVAMYWVRKRPYVIVGWLWFLGTLVPVIGLVQAGVQSMADRFAYVPVIGFFVMAVWGAAEVLKWIAVRRFVVVGVAGVVLCLCFAATSRQVEYWKDSETLFEHTVRLFEHTERVTQGNLLAMLNYAVALGGHGKLDEAVNQYRQILKLNPGYAKAEYDLGNTLGLQKKLDEAILHYRRALELKPDYHEAHYNWGNALALQWKLAEAEVHYREALRIQPDYAEAHSNYGNLLILQGRFEEAIAHCRAAISAKPKYADAHYFLGGVLARQKNFAEAVACLRTALQLKPDLESALNDLAWILATQTNPQIRDVPEAIRLAKQACGLSQYRDPMNLDTLAVAHAEAGEFGEAVKAAERAVHLTEKTGYQELRPQLVAHLNAFREGRTYRDAFPTRRPTP